MKVSVITPTYARHAHLARLYRVFKSQTHPDKELLVYDDSPTPSPFMSALQDPAVRYLHRPERMTIGAKRDRLVREADGDVIVHFDDDDYYAPGYVETMLAHLEGQDLVKLGGWFLFHGPSDGLFYWDTEQIQPWHFRVSGEKIAAPVSTAKLNGGPNHWLHKQLWGYGFTYVYRKQIYDAVQFDAALNAGEDYAFALKAFAKGLQLKAVPDREALALHVIHETNTSRAFPNHALPGFMIGTLFGSGALAHLREAGHVVGSVA